MGIVVYFPEGKATGALKLTTHLHILPRLEVGAATIPPHMPSRCTGTNLPSLQVTINITSVGLVQFCEQLITQVHITPVLHFTYRNSAVRIVATLVTACRKIVYHLCVFVVLMCICCTLMCICCTMCVLIFLL